MKKVSIPHREATNGLPYELWTLYALMFQSLIGKLQTQEEIPFKVSVSSFQSLIGKLQTLKRVINQGFLKQYSPVKVRILEIVKQRESKVSRG